MKHTASTAALNLPTHEDNGRPDRGDRSAGIRGRLVMLGCLLLLCFSAPPGLRADDLLGGLDEEDEEAAVDEILGIDSTPDFSGLDSSHLSMPADWQGVERPAQKGKQAEAPAHWRREGELVRPLDQGAIHTLIRVPKAGTYRVFLRHQLNAKSPVPVTLALEPQAEPAEGKGSTAGAGKAVEHVFGKIVLAEQRTGKQTEKLQPVLFDAQTQRISATPATAMAWEYADLKLAPGVYRLSLSKANPGVRAHAVLLTMATGFRPSFSTSPEEQTLGKLHVRFRGRGTGGQQGTFATTASAGYHWLRRHKDQEHWSWGIGNAPPAKIGEWSAWLDATDAIVNGPGPWSTMNFGFNGIAKGEADVEFAWFPHEAAVLRSVTTGIGGGGAMLRVGNGGMRFQPMSAEPAWGMWAQPRGDLVQTQEAVVERYFGWAENAARRLGLAADHPRPKRLSLSTRCFLGAAHRQRAVEMLAQLGINWIPDAPPEAVRALGLNDGILIANNRDPDGLASRMTAADRGRVRRVKIGDEISTRTGAAAVNGDPVQRRRFRDYLAKEAAAEGLSLQEFIGIRDPQDITCLDGLSDDPGLFERRLFYHSQRFGHLTTCDGYRHSMQAFQKHFPNAQVYNNYTPHPVFLTGPTMNEGDWFVLCRNQAQSLAWGEDWAYSGGWSLGTSYQCTSFYAAIVECAARKHGYPSGFYVGSNCGGSGQKIFGCLGQGVTNLELYVWGPIDALAEGSNAWSESEGEYAAILAATHALGPADEIVADGRREARRTAILYNRSHEILQGGLGRANHDWMWTFIGLKGAQIPVEVVIEEDLEPDTLKRYDVLYLGGVNLAPRHVAAVAKWVEEGGLLIGTAGAALLDCANNSLPATMELFGARQRLATDRDKPATARVVFEKSDWLPAAELKTDKSLTCLLEPTTGEPLASFAGGGCAAVGRKAGKGRTLLLGFQPGIAYRDGFAWAAADADGARATRDWLVAAPLSRLGRQRLEFDWPRSEAVLFEHETGLAVLLTDFSLPPRAAGGLLSVRADRPVKSVVSGLHGPLEWKQEGDRIEIVTKPLAPVDVIILR